MGDADPAGSQPIGVAVRLLLRPIAARIATDAFGNALGNSIAGQIGQPSEQEQVLGSTFAEDHAARVAMLNPWGVSTTSIASTGGARVIDGIYKQNPADATVETAGIPPLSVMPAPQADGADNLQGYSGTPVAFSVAKGQGVLAAMASAGLSEEQRRAMFGQLVQDGKLSFDARGTPIVQPGDTFSVDLADMSGAKLGGQLIGAESSNRAAIAAAAAQRAAQAATDNSLAACTPSNPYGSQKISLSVASLHSYLQYVDDRPLLNEVLGPQSLPATVDALKKVYEGGIAAAYGGWTSVATDAGVRMTGPISGGRQSVIFVLNGATPDVPVVTATPEALAPSMLTRVGTAATSAARIAPALSVLGTVIEYALHGVAGTSESQNKATWTDFAVDLTLDLQKGIVAGSAGAATGALVGSIFPVIGTAIGAVAGFATGVKYASLIEDSYKQAGTRDYFKQQVRR